MKYTLKVDNYLQKTTRYYSNVEYYNQYNILMLVHGIENKNLAYFTSLKHLRKIYNSGFYYHDNAKFTIVDNSDTKE